MIRHLFVYGSLRAEAVPRALEPLMSTLTSIGSATTAGTLYDLGRYPGAMFGGGATIVGEVFELPADDAELLEKLDEYESFVPADPQGSLYLRVCVDVALADGRSLECWGYIYNRDVTGHKLIAGGDYLRR